ncbi:G-type lectin S-receptor-like serine/threonine-protein kinase SD2-5 [Lycium barbarum]|uniref:G-type lectin S-receptor-like serine/threonine-protein kinase SD2-5 n=1 Tax=Lycium barbarum TaxID=112863 RepID=UPI00293E7740|nr:G-type lectin S-receptor-like serine/threonine-protein kinase SD2-5 [Lycium barbarum]
MCVSVAPLSSQAQSGCNTAKPDISVLSEDCLEASAGRQDKEASPVITTDKIFVRTVPVKKRELREWKEVGCRLWWSELFSGGGGAVEAAAMAREGKMREEFVRELREVKAYLHDGCSQKIIHLDIKPQNILLDQNFNAKISDFGLSKLIEKEKSRVVTRVRGTLGYLVPEWLRSEITEKVDVYAFGIADEEDFHLLSVFRRKAEQKQLKDLVDKNNEDMQLHREAVTEMMSLTAWCLQGDFKKRPSMKLVVKPT